MEEQQIRRVRGKSKGEMVIEASKPYILCIFANICFAGFNIVSKVYLDQGMSRYVLLVYGNAFGTLASAFLALVFERKNDNKITLPVLRDIFFLGLLGALLGRIPFFFGLEYTSPTFASALENMVPSITFILAVVCRMEKLDISKQSTQAKIVGTALAFAGAVLMTLYKGIIVISVGSTLVHTKQKSHDQTTSKLSLDKEWIEGSLMLFVSYFSLSGFYVLQAKAVKIYPAPITLTSLTCLSSTFLATIMAAVLDHKAASWRLSWNIILFAPLYYGVVVCLIAVYLQTLVTQKRGPVFMTAFRPLSTLIVAVFGLFFLGEALHLGSILGALLIVLGLYAILWGKETEKKQRTLEQ